MYISSPCRFCERHTPDCKADCPEWAEAVRISRQVQAEKDRERLLKDYQSEKIRRRRRKHRPRD